MNIDAASISLVSSDEGSDTLDRLRLSHQLVATDTDRFIYKSSPALLRIGFSSAMIPRSFSEIIFGCTYPPLGAHIILMNSTQDLGAVCRVQRIALLIQVRFLRLAPSLDIFLVWNVRGVSSRGSFHRIHVLLKKHMPMVLCLLEPFCDVDRLGYF